MQSSTPSKPRRFDREVDGILLLDKSLGLSSNAALQQARTLFRALKAGHAGSLDPLATGMLPVCFGEATKVCNWLLDAPKRYRFIAKLGERTETGDAEGQVTESRAVPVLSTEIVNDVLRSLLGEQLQTPPMYSALKHDGERLYALARRGEAVERTPRKITIEHLELLRYDQDQLEVVVECSKGTYVRTLAEDIAVRLGTVSHLIALRRLSVTPFAEGQMQSLEQLAAEFEAGGLEALQSYLIPSDAALEHMPSVVCDAAGQATLRQGRTLNWETDAPVGTMLRLYGPEVSGLSALFLGIGEVIARSRIHPRRLWNPPAAI